MSEENKNVNNEAVTLADAKIALIEAVTKLEDIHAASSVMCTLMGHKYDATGRCMRCGAVK